MRRKTIPSVPAWWGTTGHERKRDLRGASSTAKVRSKETFTFICVFDPSTISGRPTRSPRPLPTSRIGRLWLGRDMNFLTEFEFAGGRPKGPCRASDRGSVTSGGVALNSSRPDIYDKSWSKLTEGLLVAHLRQGAAIFLDSRDGLVGE